MSISPIRTMTWGIAVSLQVDLPMIAAQYPALLRASTGLEVLHSVVSGDLSSY